MSLRRLSWAGAAVAALALSPGAHAALTSTGLSCSAGTTFDAFSPTPVACSGAWEGNDANQQADLLTQAAADFGAFVGAGAEYSFLGKSDDAGNGPFTSNPDGATSGVLTFDSVQTGLFAISLKAGNAFSLYLFDGGTTGLGSVSFSTLGVQVNGQGIPAGLSHAALIGIAPIPEPASLALMVAGLAGFGVAARGRRTA